MTSPEQDKELSKGADAASEEGKALHGDRANPEVFEQPEAITLDGDTRIATEAPAEPFDAKRDRDPHPDDMVK